MASEPNFTLTQLKYFIAVAEAGSVTRAARDLTVAQSAVSVSVTNLEQSLRVQLFIRDPAKGLTMTAAGRTFLVKAREVVMQAGELGRFGHELGNSISGDLNVGCFSFVAPFFLPGVLAQFTQKYPLVNLNVSEDHLDGVEQSLLSGIIEVGLLYDVSLSPKIETDVVKSYPPYVLLASNHRLATKREITLPELQGEPLVLVDLPHSRDYTMSLAREVGINLDIAFRASSFEMVRGLVGHGHGYSILNQRPLTQQTYDGKHLVALPIVGRMPPTNLAVAYVAGVRRSRRAEAFTNMCKEFFAAPRHSNTKN